MTRPAHTTGSGRALSSACGKRLSLPVSEHESQKKKPRAPTANPTEWALEELVTTLRSEQGRTTTHHRPDPFATVSTMLCPLFVMPLALESCMGKACGDTWTACGGLGQVPFTRLRPVLAAIYIPKPGYWVFGAPSGVCGKRAVSPSPFGCRAIRKRHLQPPGRIQRPNDRLSSCACSAAAVPAKLSVSCITVRRAQQLAHQPHCMLLWWPDGPVCCSLQPIMSFPGIWMFQTGSSFADDDVSCRTRVPPHPLSQQTKVHSTAAARSRDRGILEKVGTGIAAPWELQCHTGTRHSVIKQADPRCQRRARTALPRRHMSTETRSISLSAPRAWWNRTTSSGVRRRTGVSSALGHGQGCCHCCQRAYVLLGPVLDLRSSGWAEIRANFLVPKCS